MGGGRSLRNARLRQHAVSKICALWLLTLILTPFTAPFRTIDLNDSWKTGSHDALPKDKVASDESLASMPHGFPALPPPIAVIVTFFTLAAPFGLHQPQSTILRL
jgi:hypothetical protein